MKIKNIFITGAIHIGKSTILNKVIDSLPNLKIGGFRTLPLYEDNKKKGFTFKSLEGTREIFAHVDFNSENHFDIYQFDYQVFDKIGVVSLKKALAKSDLILMDEIGMMERQAEKFKTMIIRCLNSSKIILGAFQERALWFTEFLRDRDDTKVFIITAMNRDMISEQIIELIRQN